MDGGGGIEHLLDAGIQESRSLMSRSMALSASTSSHSSHSAQLSTRSWGMPLPSQMQQTCRATPGIHDGRGSGQAVYTFVL